ncbi:MAG: tRNA (N(6)-L-threonylcarbamoyladenosine(37)-C(2))-methylthiotransferase MtaB [Chlamydiae bacterium]|nr:tRNA (N(6)-L-threonylcarbamoyladenosine(37)-C(2))-methylthiotransferase MtaB [Chlamydiota bacterium]
MAKKNFKIHALGCRTNQYEAEALAKQLRELGYAEAQSQEEADLCIVNTCTVTKDADKASRLQLRNFRKKNPLAKIVATGCYAEALKQEPMQEVDLVVTNEKKEKLLAEIFHETDLPEFCIDQFGGHTRAFVKVQDGCNSFCTYCIIPYVRGRSKSRTVESIKREISQLIKRGYKEIVLTGINIGDFDGGVEKSEKPVKLAELVREVDQMDGLKRLRLSSIDPDEVDENLEEAILSGKNTCHSLHLVLQSGSNAVLKKMNRKYTRQIFLETVNRLKSKSPDFTFTTDIIIGFPGETERDFEETLEVMHQVKFAKVHMFPFSPRKRTRAALFPNQIPQEVMVKRKQTVLELSEKLSFELREKSIGKTLRVLIEGESDPTVSGYSDNFLKVLLKDSDYLQPNSLVYANCIANSPEGLIAKVI